MSTAVCRAPREAGKQAGLKHPFTRDTVTLQDSDGQLVAENLPWVDYPKLDVKVRPAVTGAASRQ